MLIRPASGILRKEASEPWSELKMYLLNVYNPGKRNVIKFYKIKRLII